MGVDRYSARRHYLNSLTAKLGGHTPADWAALIRNTKAPSPRIRPGARAAAIKPAIGVKARADARQRRLRRAEADGALAPAPRAARLLTPAACESAMLGGSLYDGPERARVASNVGFPRLGCG